jgi:hypothetical protein
MNEQIEKPEHFSGATLRFSHSHQMSAAGHSRRFRNASKESVRPPTTDMCWWTLEAPGITKLPLRSPAADAAPPRPLNPYSGPSPTGKSVFPVQPSCEKYSVSRFTQISFRNLLSCSVRGALAIVTDVEQDAVDADALLTNSV